MLRDLRDHIQYIADQLEKKITEARSLNPRYRSGFLADEILHPRHYDPMHHYLEPLQCLYSKIQKCYQSHSEKLVEEKHLDEFQSAVRDECAAAINKLETQHVPFKQMLGQIKERYQGESPEECLTDLQETIKILQAMEKDLSQARHSQDAKRLKTQKEAKLEALQNKLADLERQLSDLLPKEIENTANITFGFWPDGYMDRDAYLAQLEAIKHARRNSVEALRFLQFDPKRVLDKKLFQTSLDGLLRTKMDLLIELRTVQMEM